jgi:hypothetical protein
MPIEQMPCLIPLGRPNNPAARTGRRYVESVARSKRNVQIRPPPAETVQLTLDILPDRATRPESRKLYEASRHVASAATGTCLFTSGAPRARKSIAPRRPQHRKRLRTLDAFTPSGMVTRGATCNAKGHWLSENVFTFTKSRSRLSGRRRDSAPLQSCPSHSLRGKRAKTRAA